MNKEMIFADNLKKAIENAGINMTVLANETGITYNMIKKYCHAQAEPTVSYALRMAKVLNVSLDELMGYEVPEAKDMFREVFEEDFTYITGFMRVVRKYGHKEAMVDPVDETTWTYDELNADVNMFSNALLAGGVDKGDVVLFQLPNCREFVFSYLAPQKIGAITSPANPNFSPGESSVCIETSKPKVYIYDAELKDNAVKALEISSHKPEVIIMAGEGELPQGHIRYEDYVAGHSVAEPETDFKPYIYDEVMRLYTSGTQRVNLRECL